MPRRLNSVLSSNAIFVTVLAIACSPVAAQDPFDSAQYPFDFDQGGWVDEEAGLVWGYNAVCVSDILNYDHGGAELFAANYPSELQFWGESNEAYADNYQAEGDAAAAAGDDEAAAFWYALAAELYEKAAALLAAAPVADGFEGWRLPTIQEAEAAYAKGLFNFPRNPTLDPADCDPRFDVRRWTSSGRGKSKYWIRPADGEVDLVKATVFGMPLVVRSINPDSGGGGNGKGKGKKK